MMVHAGHAHPAPPLPPSVLGAPPPAALGPAPAALQWWGLPSLPRNVTWTGVRPAGGDALYVYTRNYGHVAGRQYLAVRATPRAGVHAATVDYYYVAASRASARASGLGQPPSAGNDMVNDLAMFNLPVNHQSGQIDAVNGLQNGIGIWQRLNQKPPGLHFNYLTTQHGTTRGGGPWIITFWVDDTGNYVFVSAAPPRTPAFRNYHVNNFIYAHGYPPLSPPPSTPLPLPDSATTAPALARALATMGPLVNRGVHHSALPPLLQGPPEGGTLGQPYDGAPDSPYPPSGPGWFETTYDDEPARAECASLLGSLPVNHFTERLLPTGLYRVFAFENAAGAKTMGALRYWGVGAASALGLDPNLPPPPQPDANSMPEIVAAKAFLTWIAQNGCQTGFNQPTADLQTAYNASGLGPPITVDGKYGATAQGALQVVLDSAIPPLGTAPDNCYGQAMPTLTTSAPPAGGGGGGSGSGAPVRIPGITIAGRDFYDTLSTVQQAGFRSALYAQISAGKCPGIDFSTITSPDGLIDPGNRSAATGCFQFANAVGTSPGILDQATYSAVMANAPGGAPALSTASMGGISGGSLAAAGVAVLALAGLGVAVVTGKNPFELMKP